MRFSVLIFFFALSFSSMSQLDVTQIDEVEAGQIIEGSGISLSGLTHSGSPNQLAKFEVNGTSPIGINSGVVLTTGDFGDIGSTNASWTTSSGTNGGSGSSVGLQNQFADDYTLFDISALSFSFVATSDEVEFQIVFASEEYNTYVNTDYNDVCGVYMSGPGLNPDWGGYENVSIIPGTIDQEVSINNINNGSQNSGPCVNCQFFVYNPKGNALPGGESPYDIAYNGFTTPMTIHVDNLICGETYFMEFAVSNRNDENLESALFIGANSIKSDFDVDELTIVGPQPFCEGEDINAFLNPNSNWHYAWDDGQNGQGLSSITTPAVFGDNTISVVVTDQNGCTAIRSGSIDVHTNNNQPPQFLNPEEKIYVKMNEVFCTDLFTTDAANEPVFLTYESIHPTPANTYNFNMSAIPNGNADHEAFQFCAEFFNFWDYGEYEITFKATDVNVCAPLSTEHKLIVDVLCPSCPEILYVDYRNPSHNPFVNDGVVDAASELYVGQIDQFPGHEVDTEDHHIVFMAQDVYLVTAQGTNFEVIPAPGSCSSQCNDCCTDDPELSYDEPPAIFQLSPNNDNVNDVFFISDYNSPFNAYHATRFRFTIWPYSGIGDYSNSRIIWHHDSFGNYDDGPFYSCALFETPNELHPFKTFWWDGTFQGDDNVWIGGQFYNYDDGDPAPNYFYKYELLLNGCQLAQFPGDQTHPLGFDSLITGWIHLTGNMAPEFLFDITQEEMVQIVNSLEQGSLIPEVEQDQENAMLVFPNPTNGTVTLKLNRLESKTALVRIFDISGKIVYEESLPQSSTQLDLKFLEKGVYYLKVIDGSQEYIEKVVLH